MSRSPEKIYENRIAQLKRRRDFLAKRIEGYQGKNSSFDRAELSATHWALGIVENNYEEAVDAIRVEKQQPINNKGERSE